MGGSKGIVYVNLSQGGQRAGKPGLVGLFLGMEPQVLQKEDITIAKALKHGLNLRPHAVGRQGNLFPQELAEPFGNGLQAQFGDILAVGPAKVRHQDGPSAMVHEPLDRRKAFADPAVVGDFTGLVEGYVEVNTDQNALSAPIEAFDEKLAHGAPLNVEDGDSNHSGDQQRHQERGRSGGCAFFG